ncbi:TIGR00374 family protein [Halobacteriales archaeon QH_1_68_42]|nr:MAG: TIGR00374 family protein [Halobacteriales archaeon QH_1_68_42]
MNGDRWATVLGFLGGAVVLAIVMWLVGIREMVDALLSVGRPALVPVIFLNAVFWLGAWGMALRTVLGALGESIAVHRALLVFAAAIFSNNVTPFGQAGGEPVTAYLISEATDSEYETGLAAIASVDALHFVPSLGYALMAVGGLVLAIPVAAFIGWRYRYELEAAVVRVFTPVLRSIGRLIPRRDPPDAAVIERRIETFFGAIDRVAGSRTTLLEAVGFSAFGWLLLCVSLWLSLYALGFSVSFAAVLLTVPMGAVAGITPLPGGLGGVESVLIVLLVPTTQVGGAVIGAAVLVHRAATYAFPTILGGLVAFSLGLGRRTG